MRDCAMSATLLPDLISAAQTTEEEFLRHIFVRDQMAEWSKQPLIMARAEGVYYWDVGGKRYLDALSGIYVVNVGHGNPRIIDAIRRQLETLHFSPPMHGTNPLAVQLANMLSELAPASNPEPDARARGTTTSLAGASGSRLAAASNPEPDARARGTTASLAGASGSGRAGPGWTVKFQCGGSEVTEAAIKLARQYHKLTGNPGKYKIISRYQAWHGSTMASL